MIIPEYVHQDDVVATPARLVIWGQRDYQESLEAMRAFTISRTPETIDHVCVVQHPPVYTLGQAADEAHILHSNEIPTVRADRGGQVTYHGPGQLVIYPLLNLRRKHIGVRAMVWLLEQSVLDMLDQLELCAERREGAPGIYRPESGAKIAALGLRVKQMCTYHGLSVNVDMDLSPFSAINPCGYVNMPVTDIAREKGVSITGELFTQVQDLLLSALSDRLNLSWVSDARTDTELLCQI